MSRPSGLRRSKNGVTAESGFKGSGEFLKKHHHMYRYYQTTALSLHEDCNVETLVSRRMPSVTRMTRRLPLCWNTVRRAKLA